jgi:hypothetical protein
LLLTLVAALALALPAGAGAASSQHFTGGTEQGLLVSFDFGSKKVKNFKAHVRCTGKKVQVFSFPTMSVNSKGRFSVHQAGPSLDGKIKGGRGSGTLTLPGCSASANSIAFIAHTE